MKIKMTNAEQQKVLCKYIVKNGGMTREGKYCGKNIIETRSSILYLSLHRPQTTHKIYSNRSMPLF